jgi:catechol 2,3-dioxygenase-like lactoylglutathione lyase family enzyme
MKPTRIHHVQITVSPTDMDRARAFYCDVLGLPEVEKPDSLKPRGGFWLALGGQQIHVGVEDRSDHAPTKAHVAYEVGDLATWRAWLAAAGVELRESIPIPGFTRFEFRDPFGNRVEMIQPD